MAVTWDQMGAEARTSTWSGVASTIGEHPLRSLVFRLSSLGYSHDERGYRSCEQADRRQAIGAAVRME